MLARDTFSRGAVVTYGGRHAVVWAQDGAELTVLPVQPRRGASHRSDVPIDQMGDLGACGLAGGEAVIRTGAQHIVRRPAERIGHVTPRLMASVLIAVAREATQRAIENRWAGVGDNGERCVRL